MRSCQGWQQNARQSLLKHNGILQTPRKQTENSWMLLLHFVIKHRVIQQLSILLLSELLLLSSVLDRLLEYPIWTNHNNLEGRNYEFITDSCKCTFVYYYYFFHFMGKQKKKWRGTEGKHDLSCGIGGQWTYYFPSALLSFVQIGCFLTVKKCSSMLNTRVQTCPTKSMWGFLSSESWEE